VQESSQKSVIAAIAQQDILQEVGYITAAVILLYQLCIDSLIRDETFVDVIETLKYKFYWLQCYLSRSLFLAC